MNSEPKPKRTITKRLHHSPEVWAQARRDYLAGYTASAVSKRYGMSVDALRKRASKQGWCKAHHVQNQEIPPSLHPFPSEVEAVKTGAAQFASLWDEIAHDAQRAPQGVWSTWLFQGGRGAGKTRAESSCVVTQAATEVNAAHLAPSFLGGTRLAEQELKGLLLDGDGAPRAGG